MSSEIHQKRNTTIFWSLLICGLAVRLIFFAGPISSDDSSYYIFSEQLLNGKINGPIHHHASRLLFMLLIGIPTVLSHSIYTGCILSVAVSLAGALFVYAFMLRHASSTAALLAFGMTLFSGTGILYSSVFVPDNLAALLMFSVAVTAFHGIDIAHRRTAWLIGSGVLTGLAYSSKDTAVLMLPPVMLWILICMRDASVLHRLRAAALYGLAALATYLVECSVYWLIADDFLFRSHALANIHNRTVEVSSNLIDFFRLGYWAVWDLLTDWMRNGLMLILGALGTLAVLLWHRRYAGFVLIGGFITAYLLFGSSSLTRLVHLPIQDRYTLPCIPFAAIAFGLAFDAIVQRWPQLRSNAEAMSIPMLIALLAAGVQSAAAEAGSITFSDHYKNAATAIRILSANDQQIHVDSLLHHHLRHWLPSDLYQRLVVIDDMQTLAPGYYMITPTLTPAMRSSMETKLQMERMSHTLPALIDQIVTQPVVMRINISHFDAGRYSAAARDRPLSTNKIAVVYGVDLDNLPTSHHNP